MDSTHAMLVHCQVRGIAMAGLDRLAVPQQLEVSSLCFPALPMSMRQVSLQKQRLEKEEVVTQYQHRQSIVPSCGGCSEFLSRDGNWAASDLGSTVSFAGWRRRRTRRRSLLGVDESRALQLQCVAARESSSSPTSMTEGERGLAVAEKREDTLKEAEPRNSAYPGVSVDREIQAEKILDVNVFPEVLPLVWRSNSRHTYQTGVPRHISRQQSEAKPREQQPGDSLISDTSLGCEHFSRCPGCVIEKALDRPPVLQDAVQFFKSYGISDFSLTSGSLWEWRCRAKLAVRGTSENPVIGLFEEGSHSSVDIPNCRTHHPRINAAVELVKEAIKIFRIEPYDEESGSGHLRYIQMVVTTHNTSVPAAERYANGKVQISLVWNARDENAAGAKSLQPMAEFLWRKSGVRCPEPILHSIWVNFQTSRTNVIFGGKWRHLLGEQEMWERIAGADVCFTPGSFGQANVRAFETLLRKLQTHVKRGSAVVELYAGVGVIGISLAATRACRSVRCVEVNKESKTSFELSLSRLQDLVTGKISWHCADASQNPIYWLKGADVAVVDPPRKGLDPSVIEALRTASLRDQGKLKSPSASATAKVEKRPWVVRANQGIVKESSGSSDDEVGGDSWPGTLIYVSCGWQAFKKDCAALSANGAWHLEDAHAFNFFPGTDSIEVLAVFKCGKSKKRIKSGKKIKTGKKKTPGRKPAPTFSKAS